MPVFWFSESGWGGPPLCGTDVRRALCVIRLRSFGVRFNKLTGTHTCGSTCINILHAVSGRHATLSGVGGEIGEGTTAKDAHGNDPRTLAEATALVAEADVWGSFSYSCACFSPHHVCFP
jgi:hypothetical protein